MLLERFKPCLDVYLGQNTMGVRAPCQEAVWQEIASLSQGLEHVDQYLSGHDTIFRRLRVWLSGAYARPFVIEPSAGAKTYRERETLARILVSQDGCFDSEPLIWQEGASWDAPCLCVAMEVSVFESLRALAVKHHARLVGVRPWWSLVLNGSNSARTGEADDQLADGPARWMTKAKAFFRQVRSEQTQEPASYRVCSVAEADCVTLIARVGTQFLFAETHESSAHDPDCVLGIRRSLAVKGFESSSNEWWQWENPFAAVKQDRDDKLELPLGRAYKRSIREV